MGLLSSKYVPVQFQALCASGSVVLLALWGQIIWAQEKPHTVEKVEA